MFLRMIFLIKEGFYFELQFQKLHSLHPLQQHIILMTILRTSFVSTILLKLPLFVFNWLMVWASKFLSMVSLIWPLVFYKMNFLKWIKQGCILHREVVLNLFTIKVKYLIFSVFNIDFNFILKMVSLIDNID